MRRVRYVLVAAAFAGFTVQAALAQEPPPPSPATLVEEVAIIARLPGPALWRVSTPTSQIWLIAMPPQVPQDFQWDQRRVETALTGAREMVLPPGFTVGLMGGVSLMAFDSRHLIHMPPGQTVRSRMPPGSIWATFGIGPHAFPMLAQALLLGGHVRVGLEDNYYLEKGVKAPHNAALVEKGATIMRSLGHEPATPAQAREILRITKR